MEASQAMSYGCGFNILKIYTYRKFYEIFGPLLIPEPIILLAVRALPGDTVTRHSPEIFPHAVLTNCKAAPASPKE